MTNISEVKNLLTSQRISFLLDSKTAKKFEDFSNKTGLPKSKLLRDWLHTTEIFVEDLDSGNKDKKSVNYNFRIDRKNLANILETTYVLGITLSDYVRLVINKNLSVYDLNLDDAENLWLRGDLSNLVEKIDITKLSNYTFKELFVFGRAAIETGHFDNAVITMEYLKSVNAKTKSINLTYSINALESFLHLFLSLNLPKADEALINFENNKPIIDRSIAGILYCNLGELAIDHSNYQKGWEYLDTALEYLDIENHPVDIIKIYLRMSRLWQRTMNYEYGKKYLDKALRVCNTINNIMFKGIILYEYAYYYAIKNDFVNAEIYANKALKIFKENNFKRDAYTVMSFLGRLELYKGNTNLSIKLVDEAYRYKLQNQIKSITPFATTSMNETYLMSFKNYAEAKQRSNYALSLARKSEYNALHPFYVAHTMQYVNGDTEEERTKGELELKKYQAETKSILTKTTIDKTLLNKKIFLTR